MRRRPPTCRSAGISSVICSRTRPKKAARFDVIHSVDSGRAAAQGRRSGRRRPGTHRSSCWSRSTSPASRRNTVRARRTCWPLFEAADACQRGPAGRPDDASAGGRRSRSSARPYFSRAPRSLRDDLVARGCGPVDAGGAVHGHEPRFRDRDRRRRHDGPRRIGDFRHAQFAELALRASGQSSPRPEGVACVNARSPISAEARGSRIMNVSPLDLRQQRFSTALRGFDKVEVTSFLMAVADDYEQALRETDRLRQELARLEAALAEHREHEKSLQSTLMTAQRLPTTSSAQRRRGSAADRPRGGRALGAAARKDAGAARGHPARNRRPEAEAARRRDVDRIDDPDAAQHARVRARAGSTRRSRGQDPAPSSAARRARKRKTGIESRDVPVG